MGEVYRLAELKDAQRLQDITYRAYAMIRELGLHWPAATADVALIEDNIASNECYVLEIDNSVQATVTLSKGEEIKTLTELPFVKWFAVNPDSRGKGYGGKLLDWVEENIILGKLGASAVTLATAQKHPWLVSMYERRGYEKFVELDPGNGDGIMVLMRKKLADPTTSI
ncbi:acetyltransferase [Paenibacillus helianthi]|uniref:Acetyltransferase n=1 Tax=Paenibacillus helianthi TaxID=1349432 RepID=A0ABX3EHN4_9BACL|nr:MULTISPECIES: GNAT family N-acetyltransferase [Paenibacillus]OKP82786.1 acetyltransferase [Paenibacillus helianthi]OKP89430.1 acetyltransferase [Paenibacillus sp. P32E]